MQDLRKHFGGVVAVDGCSFCVRPGTVTGLIGPNGSGKTTVFNVVTGYLQRRRREPSASTGTTSVVPIPHACTGRGLSRTFQQTRVFPKLTLVENLVVAVQQPLRAMGRRHGSVPTIWSTAIEILERFGLSSHGQRRAAELSFGQRKLLEFATVLMGRPRLVLLDEPASGVNPLMIEEMERHIRDLNSEGLTFLVVEHDMNLVMRLCDPIVVLDHGAKIAEGPAADIRENPIVL